MRNAPGNWEWSAKRRRVVSPDVQRARRAGWLLVLLGGAAIVTGVLVVCEIANGPGTGPKTFETRRSYDQVKEELQAHSSVGYAIALAGLGVLGLGARRLARHPLPALEIGAPAGPPEVSGPS